MAENGANIYRGLRWGAAVLSVLICAGLIWYALQVRNQRLVITVPADTEPYKILPADPGGMKVPHRDKRIYGAAVGRPDQPEEILAKGKEKPVDATVLKTPPAPLPAPEPAQLPQPAIEAPEPEKRTEPDKRPEPDKKEVPIVKTQEPRIAAAEPPVTGWGVQLGAFATADGAVRAWDIYRKEHKTVLGEKESRVQSPAAGSDDTLHRLWAGRFADEKASQDACDALIKADPDQGCMPIWPY
jgi:hypothetical protein